MYINLNSHAPTPQKQETLKNLIQRLISIFSDYKLLEDELNYLRNVFIKINAYPPKLVNNIIKIELEKKTVVMKKKLLRMLQAS